MKYLYISTGQQIQLILQYQGNLTPITTTYVWTSLKSQIIHFIIILNQVRLLQKKFSFMTN